MFYAGEKARAYFWDSSDSRHYGMINVMEKEFTTNFAGTGHVRIEMQLLCTEEYNNLIENEQKRLDNYLKNVGAMTTPNLFKKRNMTTIEYEHHRKREINKYIKKTTSKLNTKDKETFKQYIKGHLKKEDTTQYENKYPDFKTLKKYIDNKMDESEKKIFEEQNIPNINVKEIYDIHFSYYSSNNPPYYTIEDKIYRDNIYSRAGKNTEFTKIGNMLFGDSIELRGHKQNIFRYRPVGAIHNPNLLKNEKAIIALLNIDKVQNKLSSLDHLYEKLQDLKKNKTDISANTFAIIENNIPRLKEKIINANNISNNNDREIEFDKFISEVEKITDEYRDIGNNINRTLNFYTEEQKDKLKEQFIEYYGKPEFEVDLPIEKGMFNDKLMIKKMVDELTDHKGFELNVKNCSTTCANIILAGVQNNKNSSYINKVFANESNLWTVIQNPSSVYNATSRLMDILYEREKPNILRVINETSYTHALSKYFNLKVAIRGAPDYREMDKVSSLKVPKFMKEDINFDPISIRRANNQDRATKIINILYTKDRHQGQIKDIKDKVIDYSFQDKNGKKTDYPIFTIKSEEKKSNFIKQLKPNGLFSRFASLINNSNHELLANSIWELSLNNIDLITESRKENILEQINTLNIPKSDKQILTKLINEGYSKQDINNALKFKSKYLKAWSLREEMVEVFDYCKKSDEIYESIKLRKRIILALVVLPRFISQRIINPLRLYRELESLSGYALALPINSIASFNVKTLAIVILKPLSFIISPLAGIQYIAKSAIDAVSKSYSKTTNFISKNLTRKDKLKQIDFDLEKMEIDRKDIKYKSLFVKNLANNEVSGKDFNEVIENMYNAYNNKNLKNKIIVLSKDAEKKIVNNKKKNLPDSDKFKKIRYDILNIALTNPMIKDKVGYEISSIYEKQKKELIKRHIDQSKKALSTNQIKEYLNKIYDNIAANQRSKLNPIYKYLNDNKNLNNFSDLIKKINDTKLSIDDKNSTIYKELDNLENFYNAQNRLIGSLNEKLLYKIRTSNILSGPRYSYNSFINTINHIKSEESNINNSDIPYPYKNHIKQQLSDLTGNNRNIVDIYKSYFTDKGKDIINKINVLSKKLLDEKIINKPILDSIVPHNVESYYEILSTALAKRVPEIIKNSDKAERIKESEKIFRKLLDNIKSNNYVPFVLTDTTIKDFQLPSNKKINISDDKLINDICDYLSSISEKGYLDYLTKYIYESGKAGEIRKEPTIHNIFSILNEITNDKNKQTLSKMNDLLIKHINHLTKNPNPLEFNAPDKKLIKIIKESNLEPSTDVRNAFIIFAKKYSLEVPAFLSYKSLFKIWSQETKKIKLRTSKNEILLKHLLNKLDNVDVDGKKQQPKHIQMLKSTIDDMNNEKGLLITDNNLINRLAKFIGRFPNNTNKVKEFKNNPLVTSAFFHLNKHNKILERELALMRYMDLLSKNKKFNLSKDDTDILHCQGHYNKVAKEADNLSIPKYLENYFINFCKDNLIEPPKSLTFNNVTLTLEEFDKNKTKANFKPVVETIKHLNKKKLLRSTKPEDKINTKFVDAAKAKAEVFFVDYIKALNNNNSEFLKLATSENKKNNILLNISSRKITHSRIKFGTSKEKIKSSNSVAIKKLDDFLVAMLEKYESESINIKTGKKDNLERVKNALRVVRSDPTYLDAYNILEQETKYRELEQNKFKDLLSKKNNKNSDTSSDEELDIEKEKHKNAFFEKNNSTHTKQKERTKKKVLKEKKKVTFSKLDNDEGKDNKYINKNNEKHLKQKKGSNSKFIINSNIRPKEDIISIKRSVSSETISINDFIKPLQTALSSIDENKDTNISEINELSTKQAFKNNISHLDINNNKCSYITRRGEVLTATKHSKDITFTLNEFSKESLEMLRHEYTRLNKVTNNHIIEIKATVTKNNANSILQLMVNAMSDSCMPDIKISEIDKFKDLNLDDSFKKLIDIKCLLFDSKGKIISKNKDNAMTQLKTVHETINRHINKKENN